MRKLGIFFLCLSLPLLVAAPALAKEKVYVCHAAGRQGTTKFVTLHVPANDGGFPQGHYTEGGTLLAGHEDDYLGECEGTTSTTIIETTTTTVSNVPSSTTTVPGTVTVPPTTIIPSVTTHPTTSTTSPTSTTTITVPPSQPTTTVLGPPATTFPTDTTVQPTVTTTGTGTIIPGTLPRTGTVDWVLALMGVLLFVVGCGLLALGNRRENE